MTTKSFFSSQDYDVPTYSTGTTKRITYPVIPGTYMIQVVCAILLDQMAYTLIMYIASMLYTSYHQSSSIFISYLNQSALLFYPF